MSANILSVASVSVAIGLLTSHTVLGESPLQVTEVTEGPEVEGISIIEYDPRSDRLVGATGNRIVVVSLASGDATTVANVASEIVSLALDETGSIAAILTRDDDALLLVSLDSGETVRVSLTRDFSSSSVAYDVSTQHFVVSSQMDSLFILVAKDRKGQRAVSLPGPVSGIAANGRGWLFATAAGQSTVYVADTINASFLGEFSAIDCDSPHAPVVDDVERRLYVACTNGYILAFDSDTGVVVGRTKVPQGLASLAMPEPAAREIRIFVATEDSEIWVASGRITAASAAPLSGSSLQGVTLSAGPNGAVFVVGDNEVYRLAHQ